MKRTILGLAAITLALGANAQNNVMTTSLNKSTYTGKIGIQHIKHLSDAQLREAGMHYGAKTMPGKAEVAAMVKKAIANTSTGHRSKSNITDRISAANYTAADTLLWESWENWDGETFGWTPSSWKRFSNFDENTYISEVTGSCPTWMAYKTDGYYVPYATNGMYVMLCLYGEDILAADGTTLIAPAPEQDEWLVSPTMNGVKETNVLSFDLAFTPIYTYLTGTPEAPTFDYDKTVYDMEVLITTDTRTASNDETRYTKVFKLSDVVDEIFDETDFTDSVSISNLMRMRWDHFKIPLTDFTGKNIRMAFRYKGKQGGAIMIDAVRVSDLLPVAKFDRPEGSFYLGFSNDARLNYQKSILMPAYVPNTWTNYSNEDSESFVWRYSNNNESCTSDDIDLITPKFKPGQMSWPTLQANAGLRADEFNGGCDVMVNGQPIHSNSGTAKIGGSSSITYSDGTVINFALGNFDPTKLFWLGEISNSPGIYAFGTGSEAFWSSMTQAKYNKVSGIANVFDAPMSPYIFNTVTLPLGNFFNLGANIICTVYEAKDLMNGGIEVTSNVLGQAMTSEATIVSGGHILTFNFANTMTVTTPIAISITGIDSDNIIDFAPLTQALNHDSDKGYAFVLLKNQTSGDVWWCDIAGALSSVNGGGNMQVSHCIGMNAVFPYLHSNDGDIFAANEAGETKTFDIDSYWYPVKKDETDVMNGWTIECSAPWVSATHSIDDANQTAALIITAQAMPQDMKGRSATVTLKAAGCQEVITVAQGEVTAINSTEMNMATSDGGTYCISGQRINSANAKGGIFIEKRNGKYIKVIK